LADGGRIVLPLGDAYSQSLYRFTKDGERLISENLGGFAFVPLIGRYGR
jgi:protein-L-isoaspartate(D-aspartate) O-methyltransferase